MFPMSLTVMPWKFSVATKVAPPAAELVIVTGMSVALFAAVGTIMIVAMATVSGAPGAPAAAGIVPLANTFTTKDDEVTVLGVIVIRNVSSRKQLAFDNG